MAPMAYVRKKPKGFGRNALIEGDVPEGLRTLLVEDLTTDGGSKIRFAQALRDAGAIVQSHLRGVLLRRVPGQLREAQGRMDISAAPSLQLVGRARSLPRTALFRGKGAVRGSAVPREPGCLVGGAWRNRLGRGERPSARRRPRLDPATKAWSARANRLHEVVMNWKRTLAVVVPMLLWGCATPQQQVASEENLLAASGFEPRPANTPTRVAMLRTLPPNRFSMRMHDNSYTYIYPDPRRLRLCLLRRPGRLCPLPADDGAASVGQRPDPGGADEPGRRLGLGPVGALGRLGLLTAMGFHRSRRIGGSLAERSQKVFPMSPPRVNSARGPRRRQRPASLHGPEGAPGTRALCQPR